MDRCLGEYREGCTLEQQVCTIMIDEHACECFFYPGGWHRLWQFGISVAIFFVVEGGLIGDDNFECRELGSQILAIAIACQPMQTHNFFRPCGPVCVFAVC